MTPRGIVPALAALLTVLLTGCVETKEVPDPGDEPTAEAETDDFEELSGAEIPDSAESIEVFSVGDLEPFPTYAATFTLPSEEDARSFCRSGNIGNYLVVAAGELNEEEHERHFIGESELVEPKQCSSAKQGERVARSAVFSFPEGERVSVWAVAEEYAR